jgi:hypothetical protein
MMWALVALRLWAYDTPPVVITEFKLEEDCKAAIAQIKAIQTDPRYTLICVKK